MNFHVLRQELNFQHHFIVFFFYVQWVEMRGDCLFCWYWWNCWPSLFKLSFHDYWHFRLNLCTKYDINIHCNLFSECNCNPAGAKEVPGYPLGGCGQVPVGQLCECKDNVMGHICDQCKPGYYGLDRNNPLGCRRKIIYF